MKLNKLTFLLASILLLNGCQTKPQDVDYYSLNVTKTIQTLNAHACPSTGNVKALVVPVHFSDVEEEMDLDVITKAFNGSASEVDWYSVSDFYAQSSYQKLNFEFEITSIFTPSAPATYYENKDNFNGDGYNTNASRALYKEVLDYFDDQYDYSDYDSDGDGYIDCIYLIYDHEVDYTYANQFWWAYTASYVEDDVIDDVKLKNYIWCGYSFLKKDNQECNTHTLIHETAHLFGIDDYYDYYPTTGASKGGLAGGDLMDNDDGSPSGDHNSYTY
jgi:immune inhibitor A